MSTKNNKPTTKAKASPDFTKFYATSQAQKAFLQTFDLTNLKKLSKF